MFNVLYTDLLKLKRIKIFWILTFVVGFTNFIVFINYRNIYNNREVLTSLEMCAGSSAFFINLFLGVPMIYIVTGFIFSREYSENTINTLFTYPISRIKFIVSKLITIYIIILITFTLCYFLSAIAAAVLPHEPFTKEAFLEYLKIYMIMSIMHFALVPPAALLGVFSKNIIPAASSAIGLAFINLFVVESKYIDIFPWSAPLVMTPNVRHREIISYTKAAMSLSLTFIVFMTILLIIVKKTDIHCGA